MNKTKKTYGIKGFMEYQAVIKMGKGKMKVPFTDGSLNAMGVNPATYTTDNYMTQHAIENSAEFKRGLIYIVSSIELDGKVEIERPSPRPTLQPVGSDSTDEGAEKPATDEEATEEKPEQETWPAKSNEADAPLTPVEFASNDEAKDYLEQHFGLVRSKLRNREDISAAGKANGVEIIFI